MKPFETTKYPPVFHGVHFEISREVRAESGAWFFEEERKKGDRPQLFGSALLRASLRRAKLPCYGAYRGLFLN